MPFAVQLSKKYSKKAVWLVGLSSGALSNFLIVVITPTTPFNIVLVTFLSALQGIGFWVSLYAQLAILADTIDYDHFITGENREGQYSAIR